MGLEAGNPVVGGTVLRRAAIQSPNFLTGSSGWSINQDGSAEFNNLIIRNGQIVSGVALYYSGPPALNNLILAISATNGSDTHGNNFFAGVTMYNGHGAVVNLFSSARSAFFQYNDHGTAVQGSLILSVASTAGIDPVTGVGYNPGLIGTDPVFGSQMGVVGATINFNVGGTFSQTSRIQSQIGAGANSPYVILFAPEQGVSGHLVLLMQGTSPDGTHLGQFLIAREPTGFTVPTPITSALIEFQSPATALPDSLLQLITAAGGVAGDNMLGFRVSGDTFNRLRVNADGTIRLGSGAAGQDCILYRAAAGLMASSPIAADISGAAETAHAFTFANGWLQAAGRPATQFLLSVSPATAAAQSIHLGGSVVVPAGFVTGQAITTAIPLAYRPVHTVSIIGADVTVAGNGPVRLVLTSGGILQYSSAMGTAVAAGDTLDIPPTTIYLNN